jgi:hypothetical protein
MDKSWFELNEIRRRRLADAVWIPLRVSEHIGKTGEYGYVGYKAEYFGLGSVAVPRSRRAAAKKLNWSDLGGHDQRHWATKDYYKPVDVYQYNDKEDLGTELVLRQHFDADEPTEWHLHQDLVFALGLKREGDAWIRPSEDYCEVVRLRRNKDGDPIAIEIKNEFLRDYLCARDMFLRTSMYRSRSVVVADTADVGSPEAKRENTKKERFELRVYPVIEGGRGPGGYAVFRVSRNDVDPDDDVPTMGPETNDNTEMEKWEGKHEGRELTGVWGELWRDEDIEPADNSIRVRGDEVPTGIRYIVDASGETQPSEKMNNEDDGRWLWFRPEVVLAILKHRGSDFRWYTKDTGGISLGSSILTHFGLNGLGLVNVYAYDIAKQPVWQQRIWAGYNIAPEGGVSGELLSSQVRAIVAETKSPEAVLPEVLQALDELFEHAIGTPLFRAHADTAKLMKYISRFRALEPDGLFALAKDLMRIVADRIDHVSLQKVAPPPKGVTWRSLKSLEGYLATIISADDARRVMGPLAGAYDLRVADAHPPGEDLDKAYQLARVAPNAKLLDQGFRLIASVVSVLMNIANIMADIRVAEERRA